jgi:hypothetical protein
MNAKQHRFKFLAAESTNIRALWDSVPCSFIKKNKSTFRGAYCLNHQGEACRCDSMRRSIPKFCHLQRNAVVSYEIPNYKYFLRDVLVSTYKNLQRNSSRQTKCWKVVKLDLTAILHTFWTGVTYIEIHFYSQYHNTFGDSSWVI